MRMPRLALATIVAIVLAGVSSSRATAAPAADRLPSLTEPVNDFAHVIDAASAAEMDRQIRALTAASGDVVVVATVPTIEPYGDAREYATKLFENGGRGIGISSAVDLMNCTAGVSVRVGRNSGACVCFGE